MKTNILSGCSKDKSTRVSPSFLFYKGFTRKPISFTDQPSCGKIENFCTPTNYKRMCGQICKKHCCDFDQNAKVFTKHKRSIGSPIFNSQIYLCQLSKGTINHHPNKNISPTNYLLVYIFIFSKI